MKNVAALNNCYVEEEITVENGAASYGCKRLYRARDMANLDVKNEKVTTPTKKITDKFNSIKIKTCITKIEEKVEKHVSVPKLSKFNLR